MYIISYDIENNRIRNKIAKELENFGMRVQYSVFECRISEEQYKIILYPRLVKLMEEEKTGNIRIYNICKSCEGKISTIGVDNDPFDFDLSDIIII